LGVVELIYSHSIIVAVSTSIIIAVAWTVIMSPSAVVVCWPAAIDKNGIVLVIVPRRSAIDTDVQRGSEDGRRANEDFSPGGIDTAGHRKEIREADTC
jgi:hypothetical protein